MEHQLPPNLRPDEASPEWMNKGDNAWQLTAATLVALQSMPGLVILYGGMVKKKWAINSSLMAVYAFAVTLVCWMGWGYRMAFGDKLVAFWGKPAVALDDSFLLGQAFIGYFPTATMVWFQFGFAAYYAGSDRRGVAREDEFCGVDDVCAVMAYVLLYGRGVQCVEPEGVAGEDGSH
ncbi:UNVERIFIED_CONTAM: Ammonium transporter 2 [Sesamum angustifolium]|uniref:Ammonium transporter 2 n=1 Tax=Sesamum angustifolium TaxID=2727405 RepID=A0AAW2RJU1_9LAMI